MCIVQYPFCTLYYCPFSVHRCIVKIVLFVGRFLATKVFFRQIAGYVMGVDDHRVGCMMTKGDHGPTKLLHALTWGAFDCISHAPQVRACNTITYSSSG